ncbi:MAG: hypothetical protein AAF386_09565 [Pseudomonadota bacterium]
MDIISFTIGDAPPRRLDKALARDVPEGTLSRSRLAKLVADGAVVVDGVVVTDGTAKVAAGAQVQVSVPVAAESHILPQDIALDVVFEDDDLVVVSRSRSTPRPSRPAPSSSSTRCGSWAMRCSSRQGRRTSISSVAKCCPEIALIH